MRTPTTYRLVCCAVLASVWVNGVQGQALPAHGPSLNWVRLPGADGCIAPVELANRVEQRLGRAVFVRANDAILVIEGRVGPAVGGGFSAVLRVSDPDGTLYGSRELHVATADCHELDDIMALVIAITIRHEHAGAGIELPAQIAAQLDALFASEPSALDPSDLPKARAEPSAAPAPIPQAAPLTAAAPPASWQFGAKAGMALETGIQPRAAFSADVRVYAAFAGFGVVGLSGLFSVPQTQAVASGQLDHRFIAFGAQLCPPAWRIWLSEFALCGELRVGRLSVDPSGFLVQYGAAHEVWAELVPSALLRTQLFGPSHVLLAVGVPVRLRRPEFGYVDDEGQSHTAFVPSLFGFQLELALGVAF
jgi:hypothetical protein